MNKAVALLSAIEDTGEQIYTAITDAPPRLQNDIDSWVDLHGLTRLDEPLKILARQASLNLLLKATLYEHYQENTPNTSFNELDASNAREAFRTARELTGDSAFTEYLLDELAWVTSTEDLSSVLDARQYLLNSDNPAETIGQLFEQITPQESRRKLGQFRTPPEIAEIMATWCVQESTDTILDPGVGAGALSAPAYKRKLDLSSDASLATMHGIDLNELALVMGATTLRLLDHGGPHSLQTGDFLELSPEDIDAEVDAVISNPPYSRHHELSEEYKTRVNTQIEQELGCDVSALSPMYAYFYFHAEKFLSPGGRASYITPSEFLETNYGESLKQYLTNEFNLNALVLFDRDEDSVFSEAMTTSLVSFLEKPDGGAKNDFIRFIRVDDYPGKDVLLEAITDGIEGETDWGFVNVVRQADLEPEDKWTTFFDPIDLDTSQLTPLEELATVNRGIATGANSFFCLSQQEVDEWGIEKRYLSPLVRNSRSVPTYDYRKEDWEKQRSKGDEVWLLYHLEKESCNLSTYQKQRETKGNARLSDYVQGETENENREYPNIVDYLKYGMSDNVEAHDSYLARNRDPWYVVDRRDPAPILVTYMSRGGCRFILNETESRNLNNLHSIYLNVGLDTDEMKSLLAYLNSGFADDVVRRSGRTYSTGMDKIEPNELQSVPVLDPRDLSNETVDSLARAFDELREIAREEGNNPDPVITKIDQILERELQQG
ncbi:N-6 DNA methylase [Halogeometricum borinquense]|uniref:N-6 DNA methylase n=1 Tax=Halogeometricum borinquense TaxID=60847 RepID=A0A6C0ULK5_9EURY|nr:N-6 DNA methylase [Halogeometricum borinquense]QIB75241.1 N-6 DNA methylase [Halogeometricum borinquense]QIQ75816.1 N-6 DNA methylase [Halogeometricum borinquense]